MRTFRALLLMLAAGTTLASGQQQIQVSVNGSPVQFTDVNPIMLNDRVMVPLRGVFEQMGASVSWSDYNHTVTAMSGTRQVVLRVGNHYAMVNGSQVQLDSPAIMMQDRVMVPLRFVGESFGANVSWNGNAQLVSITTATAPVAEYSRNVSPTMASISSGTVIPVRLNDPLGSDISKVGDGFTAVVNTGGADKEYAGLPYGTVITGHVDTARAKTPDAPGVLGLTFDRARLPDGTTYALDGSVIGTDDKSVDNVNGRLTAKDSAAKKDLKFVGYGAGAGALLSIVTKGNLVTDTVIGAALGYLFGSRQQDASQYNNVTLQSGSEFGVRLNRDFAFAMQTPR